MLNSAGKDGRRLLTAPNPMHNSHSKGILANMPNAGTQLEVMAESLQCALCGSKGITVKRNELFYDNDGNKICEIDITLRGKVGSAEIFVGIECRDRPADGPQGAPWITEIHGKKSQVGAHRMIAVSTTGFIDGAITTAKKFDIDLICVEQIDESFANEWFKTITFDLPETSFEFIGNGVKIDVVPKFIKFPPCTNQEMEFWDESLSKWSTLREFFDSHVDSLFKTHASNSNAPTSKALVHTIFGHINSRIHGKPYEVSKIEALVKLNWFPQSVTTVLNAHRSTFEDEILGATGICRYEGETRCFYIFSTLSKSKTREEGKQDLNVKFLDDKYEPYQLPMGTTLSLYAVP